MEIKQKTILEVEKGEKIVQLIVDQDMPLGLLFDCLMELKGYCADRMAKAHQAELAEAESKMAPEEIPQVIVSEDAQEELPEAV